MAMSAANFGNRRTRRRRRYTPMSEINVTPFVDVMLVLLIVFMVSAPLLTVGVPVDLPESPARPIASERKPITVTVRENGEVYVEDALVPVDQVVQRLLSVSADGLDERIYVRGDKASSYGAVMRVMGTLNGAGFRRIGLVTLPEDPN